MTSWSHRLLSLHSWLQVDQALGPGLVHITWSSLNVSAFLRSVSEAIEGFQKFTKQVCDLYECRIMAHLETMSVTVLLNLPVLETWTVEQFLEEANVSSIGTTSEHKCT